MSELKQTFNFYDQTYLKSYNLNNSIQYQLNLLDSLDVYTRKHCENVATITCNLCKKLHLSRGFTEYCTICAYLHDVGKLFIPSSILQKPSMLTNEEYEIMKKHTTLGYELCLKDAKLRPYYVGTYYHHESLDGTGYPQGLVQDNIPFEAQIIRVADEYDALVSKRQYKSHVGISDALKIIIEDTKPSSNASPNNKFYMAGKVNKNVVKKLLKVVIDDIEYELSSVMDYVDLLKKEILRYKKIDSYITKMYSAKDKEHQQYYEEYAKIYLHSDESIEKFDQLYKELLETYESKENTITELVKEIKIIKKLHV